MKTKIIVATLLLFNVTIQAQELSVKVNGGPSGILYDSTLGKGKLKFGAGIGVEYTYFLNQHWGIASGIDIMYNQNSFTQNNDNTFSTYEVDDQTSAFEYRVTPTNYKEKQHFISAAIPLLLQYRTPISSRSQLYFGFGGKILFPGKLTVKASASQIQLSGFYPDMNLVIDDLPSHGFGTVSNWQDKTTTSLDPSFLLSAETGLTFKLKEKMQLYTGVYVDYGLSDLAKSNSDTNLVKYDPFGIDNTQANGATGNQKVIQQSRYFSAGIQLKLGFSMSKNKSEPVQSKAIIVEPTQTIVAAQETEPAEQVAEETTPTKRELTPSELTLVEKPLVFQEIGNTSVTPELATKLNAIAKILQDNKDTELNITGYTCDIGTTARNLEIGMQRAQAVAEYLKEKGITSDRMHLFSKGESDPLVPNTPDKNKPLNRRVSLVLID